VLYDLFWVYPLPAETRPKPVEYTQTNLLDRRKDGVPAAILYPALATPEIVAEGHADGIELLIVTKDADDLNEYHVNEQLKIAEGLDPLKKYRCGLLFEQIQKDPSSGDGNHKANIEIKALGAISKATIYETPSGRFAGVLDRHAVDLYKERGFSKLWAVWIDKKALAANQTEGAEYALNEKKGDFIEPRLSHQKDNQDHFIREAVETDMGEGNGEGKYGFKGSDGDVVMGRADGDTPVQGYHPVFWYDTLAYVGFGHTSDLHSNARQPLFQRWAAKVIDTDEVKATGAMVNSCCQNIKSLLDRFGGDSEVNAVIMSGDLVTTSEMPTIPTFRIARR